MKSLKDMSILVTGGGSGIGLGTARYCISEAPRSPSAVDGKTRSKRQHPNSVKRVTASRQISLSRLIDKNYWGQPSIMVANLMRS